MVGKILINVFNRNGGAAARIITGLICSAITAACARFGLEMSAGDTAEISTLVGLIVAGVIGELVARAQSNGIKEIQTAVAKVAPEVNSDGHAGEVTKSAVERVSRFIETIQQDGFTPPPAEPPNSPP